MIRDIVRGDANVGISCVANIPGREDNLTLL